MRRTICLLLMIVTGFAAVSCATVRHDNGKHKGWYKNPNNPHHPLSGKKKKKKKKPRKEYQFHYEHTKYYRGL